MIKRTIEIKIKEALKAYPVVVVTGARQIGKSTEVYKFIDDGFKYVSLDNLDERRLAIEDPKYFIERHGYPLIIDEVQYAPVLMDVIVEIVNKKRIKNESSNGLFILTGSQKFKLMKNVSESMAGRAAILEMEPLSYNEIKAKDEIPFLPNASLIDKRIEYISINELYKQIIKGFYPEIYSNTNITSEMFYSRYVSTYIDRDVNDLLEIKHKREFHNFMQVLASLTSQQINMSNISKVVGVSVTTIKEWISVLEASGLIYLLQSYNDISITKRVVKLPKLYFSDTGLAAYLLRINDPLTLEASVFAGAFMETYVMNEIRKSYINNGKVFNGYYYRDSNNNEIDLIILDNAKLYLTEIKKGNSFKINDVKSFDKLESSLYKTAFKCIICNTQDNYALSKDIHCLNISVI